MIWPGTRWMTCPSTADRSVRMLVETSLKRNL